MNIGLVTDFYFPWIGGPSIVLRNLGYGLAARGHAISLLAPSATGPPSEEYDGPMRVTRMRTVTSPFGFDLRVAPFAPRDIGAWFRSARPDIIHIHHPFPICSSALFAARRRGIPVAATNHTIPECSLWGLRNSGLLYTTVNAAMGRWIALTLNRSAGVATPTATAANALSKLGYSGHVEVISNGVDLSRFHPGDPDGALRARLHLDERPVVLYTGRLDAEKQMDVWLRTASMLKDIPVQFVVGGQGADRTRLTQLAAELDLTDRLRFIGYVGDDDLPSLYRLASVYFITSPVELQSISTLEATASGLPVVGVNAGALPELVLQNVNGYLVAPGDSVSASLCLRDVLSHPDRAARLGGASRSVALDHGVNVSIDAYERFLLRVADTGVGERLIERATLPG